MKKSVGNLKKIKPKTAQMELSFGMIFSILLIIVFVALAIYIIMTFMKWQTNAKIALYVEDLQTSVDDMWKSVEGNQKFEEAIPSGKITYLCFIDFSKPATKSKDIYRDASLFKDISNTFFYPLIGGNDVLTGGVMIQHLNISATTKTENPLCFKNEGKVSFNIVQEYGGLPRITR